MYSRTKYAVFIDGNQVTEFELTEQEANAMADGFIEDGETNVEVSQMDIPLEECDEYWEG